MRNWTAFLITLGLMAAVAIFSWAIRRPPQSSAEVAAWLQAFGGLFAIAATVGVAFWVPANQARERQRGLLRAAAHQLDVGAGAIGQLAALVRSQGGDPGKLFKMASNHEVRYDLRHYIAMLSAFPLHELDAAEVPALFTRMHNCIVRAGAVVDWYNANRLVHTWPARDAADKLDKIHSSALRIVKELQTSSRTPRRGRA